MLTQKYESLNTHESLQNMRFRLMKTTLELDHYLPRTFRCYHKITPANH